MSPTAEDEDGESTSYRINIVEGAIESPEQPEPLTILRRLRRFNSQMWAGGYADQPHILMMEFNTCIETEIEIESNRLYNQILIARLKANKNG